MYKIRKFYPHENAQNFYFCNFPASLHSLKNNLRFVWVSNNVKDSENYTSTMIFIDNFQISNLSKEGGAREKIR